MSRASIALDWTREKTLAGTVSTTASKCSIRTGRRRPAAFHCQPRRNFPAAFPRNSNIDRPAQTLEEHCSDDFDLWCRLLRDFDLPTSELLSKPATLDSKALTSSVLLDQLAASSSPWLFRAARARGWSQAELPDRHHGTTLCDPPHPESPASSTLKPRSRSLARISIRRIVLS